MLLSKDSAGTGAIRQKNNKQVALTLKGVPNYNFNFNFNLRKHFIPQLKLMTNVQYQMMRGKIADTSV